MRELEHLKTVAQDGIYKAPALESGGVLVAVGRATGAIVLGQGLSVGFIGPVGDRLEFTVSPRAWRWCSDSRQRYVCSSDDCAPPNEEEGRRMPLI